MMITGLPMGHGFGINTNLLDTNVINLAVVVAIVISVLGDALRELLGNRKAGLLKNLTAADERAREIEDQMQGARTALDRAHDSAAQIRAQGQASAQREKTLAVEQADAECDRLKQLCGDRLRFHQQRATEQISQQFIVLSIDDAYEALEKMMKSSHRQIWVNTKKMTYYVTIQDHARALV